MIIDGFIMFDELDMLEFRLRLLWDRVDRFVIVEADKTFTGHPKPFYYLENQSRFDWAKEKIVHVKWKMLYSDNPWLNEHQQRESILQGCEGFNSNDVLIISDIDEIPHPDMIGLAIHSPCFMPLTCQQFFFYYNLNTLRQEIWRGSTFVHLGWARLATLRLIRDHRNLWPSVRNAGWHLSYFGDVARIQKKIDAFSHQEYNTAEFTDADHIGACIDTGADLFNRGVKSGVPPDGVFPDYFVKHASNYQWGL